MLAELGWLWSAVDHERAGAVVGLAEAEALGLSGADPSAMAGACLAVARAWVSIDPGRARATIAALLERAKGWPDALQRDQARYAIARLTAWWDPGGAIGLAEAMESHESAARLLCAVGRELAAFDRPSALDAYGRCLGRVIGITDPYRRCLAMAALGEAWGVIEPEAGQRAFADAVKTAAHIGNQSDFALALAALGGRWGRVDADKAFQVAALIPEGRAEARAALFILAAEGRRESRDADALCRAAVHEARKVDGSMRRDRFLAQAAGILARHDPEEAVAIASDIDPDHRTLIALTRLEAVRRLAWDDPDAAMKIARQIPGGPTRAMALVEAFAGGGNRMGDLPPETFETLGPEGDPARARWAMRAAQAGRDEAMEAAKRIIRPDRRAACLVDIARVFFERGRRQAGRRALAGAHSVGEKMGLQNPAAGSKVLVNVGRGWTPVDPGQAIRVFEAALGLLTGGED